MTREKRWIVLGDDGRHVSLGRHTDPSPEEISQAGHALQANGMGGWLAVMDGTYYQPRQAVTLLMVRELAPPRNTWEQAVEDFNHFRQQVSLARPNSSRYKPGVEK